MKTRSQDHGAPVEEQDAPNPLFSARRNVSSVAVDDKSKTLFLLGRIRHAKLSGCDITISTVDIGDPTTFGGSLRLLQAIAHEEADTHTTFEGYHDILVETNESLRVDGQKWPMQKPITLIFSGCQGMGVRDGEIAVMGTL